MEQNEYKELKVDISVSTGVYRMAKFLEIIAILSITASVILFFMWVGDFDYDGEDYILPFIITLASGLSLLVTQSVLKALSKITEAAEYTKADISSRYNAIKED